jgi:hypothetical protein
MSERKRQRRKKRSSATRKEVDRLEVIAEEETLDETFEVKEEKKEEEEAEERIGSKLFQESFNPWQQGFRKIREAGVNINQMSISQLTLYCFRIDLEKEISSSEEVEIVKEVMQVLVLTPNTHDLIRVLKSRYVPTPKEFKSWYLQNEMAAHELEDIGVFHFTKMLKNI